MLQAPFIVLALAGTVHDCDLRARVAGELMSLHQSGASAPALFAFARTGAMPEFATVVVSRVMASPRLPERGLRELVAYHFSALIHAECRGGSSAVPDLS